MTDTPLPGIPEEFDRGVALVDEEKYDEAIAEFDKALAAFPFHASAEFGIARAYQRKGDLKSAREHLTRFQKITAEHLQRTYLERFASAVRN